MRGSRRIPFFLVLTVLLGITYLPPSAVLRWGSRLPRSPFRRSLGRAMEPPPSLGKERPADAERPTLVRPELPTNATSVTRNTAPASEAPPVQKVGMRDDPGVSGNCTL
eukprot:RCo035111